MTETAPPISPVAAIAELAYAWDAGHPCPVCAGHPGKRTKATRCSGGLNANGSVAYCTLRESQGKPLAHRLGGNCGCGLFHAKPPGGNGAAPHELNGYHHGPDGNPAFTDTRNAQRLVDRFGEHVRKDHTRGKNGPTRGWRIYDGARWDLDQTEVMMLRAKAVVAELAGEIETYREEHPVAAPVLVLLRNAALACESTGRLNALLQNAGSLVPATHETWDPDPYLLNCRNGTVDLRTGELLEHNPTRWQSKLAPVNYDPECPTPLWDRFLERVFGGDQELVAFVQRAVGLSLVGKVIEHVLFVMYGTGANGKSTFTKVWLELLGEYGREASMDLLVQHETPQHPTSIAELEGVRFVSVGELRGQRFDEDLVKALTGGGIRNARHMFQDPYNYVPGDTFWMATNHKPSIVGNSEGIWRRVRLLPFEAKIPDAEQDREIGEKLRDEYPGILAWAVRGCLEWQRDGLGHAAAVDAATATYRLEMDTLAAFLGDRCIVSEHLSVGAADLYKAYEAWCEPAGEKPASQKWFGLRLGERGFTRRKGGHDRRWIWDGLRLRGDDDLFDGTPDGETPPASARDINYGAAEPPERADHPVKNSENANPFSQTHNPVQYEIEPMRTHEPIDPFKACAQAPEDSNVGVDSARAREDPALNGPTGSWVRTDLETGTQRVRLTPDAPKATNTPKSAVCSFPVRAYPPDATACPGCGGTMHHRAHAGHFDHDCPACTLRFRDH